MIAYGMGAFSLYERLNGDNFPITLEEARNLYKRYCTEFSTGVKFLRDSGRLAARQGYLSNINGRRRHWLVPNAEDFTKYPKGYEDEKYMAARAAIEREGGNFLIQSVNADITKHAMTKIREYIKANKVRSTVVLQVYDEIVTHTHKDDSESFHEAKLKIMVAAANRWINSVPVEVDGHVLPYWTK